MNRIRIRVFSTILCVLLVVSVSLWRANSGMQPTALRAAADPDH